MNNIKKYKTNTPLLVNATGDDDNTIYDGGTLPEVEVTATQDEPKAKTPWWQIFDSVADTVSGVFSNIVFPWMNGGTTEYTFYEAQQKKDETGKYVIIGVVIIVVVLILARMLKK